MSAALQYEGLAGRTEVQLFCLQPAIRGFLSQLRGIIGKPRRCHLTPLFQCGLFPSSLPKRKGRRASESFSDVGLVRCNSSLAVRLEKLLHTELHISGSGSANVGDRGIWGLKPLYLPLHKSRFIAYTSALANMICIVTSLPAG